LKRKSDVLSVFQDFQKLVERKLNKKIIAMQSDWSGEYEKLNSFFQRIGITHRVSCPTLINKMALPKENIDILSK
jgi:hypothetical protein